MKDMKEKIQLFYTNKIYTYIKLDNGRFYNGFIKTIIDNSFIFTDDLLGDIPILFSELDKVDTSNKPKEVMD